MEPHDRKSGEEQGATQAVETGAPTLSRRELAQRLFAMGAGALATALSAGASVASLTMAPPARAAVPQGGIPAKRKFRYGMVIDTRRCVGCRACVVACKAENKTPPGVSYTVVVEEALGNRTDDKPLFMTKPCFHCENPPCVDVCPVSATFKPATASRYGIGDGDLVWVESPYGRVKARVKTTTRIHPEVVGLQHGFGHTALGRLAKGRGTSDSPLRPTKSDPLSGQAMHKEACVRIVRA